MSRVKKTVATPFRTDTNLEAISPGNIYDMAEIEPLSHEQLGDLNIIYPGMHQRKVLNAFRDLRTKLLQGRSNDNLVVLISSLSAGGGSSFTAMNLATSFALDEGKTAIYIDCNFEDSFADKLLRDSSDFGLIDYLNNPDEVGAKDIIYSSGVPRVRIIPSGKSTETAFERLGSGRMLDLVRSLKERYPDRFIVMDVPPVCESSLARLLLPVIDLAVLVVPFGKVTANQVMAGVDVVGESKLAGLVLNME